MCCHRNLKLTFPGQEDLKDLNQDENENLDDKKSTVTTTQRMELKSTALVCCCHRRLHCELWLGWRSVSLGIRPTLVLSVLEISICTIFNNKRSEVVY